MGFLGHTPEHLKTDALPSFHHSTWILTHLLSSYYTGMPGMVLGTLTEMLNKMDEVPALSSTGEWTIF